MRSRTGTESSPTHLDTMRRLRTLAHRALEPYDIRAIRLRLLKDSWNTVFRVDAADGQSYVLRINRPGVRDLLAIESELTWIDALGRDTDIIVPVPVRAQDGSLVSHVGMPGVPETRYVALFHWIGGRHAKRRATQRVIALLGETMALLHDHADAFVPPQRFTRERLDHVGTFSGTSRIHADEEHPLLLGERMRLFRREAARVQAELDRLYDGPSPPRFLHLDVHLGNVKQCGDRLAVLDFDDSMWAYPVQDIAISLYYLRYLRGLPEDLCLSFKRGYGRVRAWPEEWEGQIDLLMEARALDLVDVVLAADRSGARECLPDLLQGIEDRVRALTCRR